MMWRYSGTNWWWIAAMLGFLAGALLALVVVAARALTRTQGTDGQAMDTLRNRFETGEITQDEFDKTERILHG